MKLWCANSINATSSMRPNNIVLVGGRGTDKAHIVIVGSNVTGQVIELVVDDEPAIRKLLRVGLTAEGYSIVEATDARTAMEKVEAEQPDLILLDLGLPDMQGTISWPNGAPNCWNCPSSSCRAEPTKPASSKALELGVQHAGKVITHQHLLTQAWGAPADVQYLRIYVRQLRRKIEQSPNEPHNITTETGVGYRLREAA